MVKQKIKCHENLLTYSVVTIRNLLCYLATAAGNRADKRSELFRLNEYGDLVIIIDDHSMEHVFGETIERLVENLRCVSFHIKLVTNVF